MNFRFGPRRPRRSFWLAAVAGLPLLLLPRAAFAQTPSQTLIPFQGRLTNQTGVAYENGQYTITLNLYSLAIGGSTVWTERHEKVSVIGGMLNLFLGSIFPFDKGTPSLTDDVDFSTTKYLGITVDADNNPATADPEMVPRTMIVNAFHSQNSSKLAGSDWSAILQGGSNNPQAGTIRGDKLSMGSVTNVQLAPQTVIASSIAEGAVTAGKLADNSITTANLAAVVRDALIPPGTILPYGGTAAPAGFLMCDGGSYFRVGVHASLFAVVQTSFGAPDAARFCVPDLRGMFLRGVDGTAGQDPDKASRIAMAINGASGNAVGSIQADDLKSHTHSLTHLITPASGGQIGGNGPTAARAPDQSNYVTVVPAGGSETRPKNAYVNYIIKY